MFHLFLLNFVLKLFFINIENQTEFMVELGVFKVYLVPSSEAGIALGWMFLQIVVIKKKNYIRSKMNASHVSYSLQSNPSIICGFHSPGVW